MFSWQHWNAHILPLLSSQDIYSLELRISLQKKLRSLLARPRFSSLRPFSAPRPLIAASTTALAELLTVCLTCHRKKFYVSRILRSSSHCAWQEVYVSSFLQSSSKYVWQATKRMFRYHHSYRVLHDEPGKQPKSSVRITSLTEFLTVCLAGHRK
jgi:hypothetical protein